MVSGNSAESVTIQSEALLKSIPAEERQKILKAGKVNPASIGAEKFVAMKANLGLPWQKMRVMAR